MTYAADAAYTFPIPYVCLLAFTMVCLFAYQEWRYYRRRTEMKQQLINVSEELNKSQKLNRNRSEMMNYELNFLNDKHVSFNNRSEQLSDHPALISLAYSNQLIRTLNKIWRS